MGKAVFLDRLGSETDEALPQAERQTASAWSSSGFSFLGACRKADGPELSSGPSVELKR